jgi:phage shock protein A
MSLLDLLRALRASRSAVPGAHSDGIAALEGEYQKLLSDLEAIRRSIADATASRRRLQAQLDKIAVAHEAANERARTAAREGRDEPARAALREALEAERTMAERRKTVEALAVRDGELKASAARVEARIHEYRARLDAVRTRADEVGRE